MQQDIKKDYFWNTLGVFLQNAISPLLLVAITRINGIFDSGIFSFAFSVAIIFWAIGMWGGRTYQVSDVRQEFSHRSYIMVRLILAVLMLVGAIVFITTNHYDVTKSSVIIALVLFKIIESIADVIYGILQTHNRLYIVGKSLSYKAIGGFITFVIIDILTKDILLSCMGIVAINIVIFLFYDLPITRKLDNIKMHSAKLRHYVANAFVIMKRCSPVFAVLFLAMFSLNIPRYFVDLYHEEEIGYFGIITMPVTLVVLLVSFVLQPNVLRLSRLYDKKKYTEFNKIVGKLVSITSLIGIAIFVAAFMFGIFVLQLLFGVDFSSYKLALMILIVGGIINALVGIFINILTIIRHIRAQFYVLLLTNILLAVASVNIIKEQGLLGGVGLFTVTSIVQVALLAAIYVITLKKATNAEKN